MSYNELDITGAWDYGSLPPNVRVGQGCWFERRDSFVRFRSQNDPGLVLGNRVRVFTWTTFNVEPTGYIESATIRSSSDRSSCVPSESARPQCHDLISRDDCRFRFPSQLMRNCGNRMRLPTALMAIAGRNRLWLRGR